MRLINLSHLKVGMIVGRPVIDDQGRILLNGGKELTEAYIKALEIKGYTAIYVADKGTGVIIEGDEDLNTATRSKAIHALRRAYEMVEDKVPGLRDRSFNDISAAIASKELKDLMGAGGPFDAVEGAAGSIISEVLNRSTLAGLTSIKSVDSQLYHHSVDVCVVALMIGKAISLPAAQMKQLALGCLLHDIGKIFTNPSADALTKVRQHALLGYEMLRNSPSPDILAPHVALEHHEWQDGSGEPRGIKGSNTIARNRSQQPPIPTLIGEIAAIANVYDNLLTGTHSRPPLTPDAAIQAVRSAAGKRLNQELVDAFVRMVPVFPQGIEVLVRSEEYRNYTGIVSKVNPEKLDKPQIILFRDNQKNLIEPIELNMMDHPELVVRSILT
jgi:putative nucleotidyltransferase with HDIG domain